MDVTNCGMRRNHPIAFRWCVPTRSPRWPDLREVEIARNEYAHRGALACRDGRRDIASLTRLRGERRSLAGAVDDNRRAARARRGKRTNSTCQDRRQDRTAEA